MPICLKLRLRRMLPDRVLFHGSEGNWDYHLLLMVGVLQKTHCCKDCKPWMVILSLTTELLMDTRTLSGQHWYPSLCCGLGTCGTWWWSSLNMIWRRKGSSMLHEFLATALEHGLTSLSKNTCKTLFKRYDPRNDGRLAVDERMHLANEEVHKKFL